MDNNCRFCGKPLEHVFVDLGATPLANAYLRNRDESETFFDLRAYICDDCKLVQVKRFETPDNIFSEYSYFSSVSSGWLAHCKAYSEKMMSSFQLNEQSFVVEIASNDGCLLKYFVNHGIKALGIEPARNVAATAIKNGVDTISEFFGSETASRVAHERGRADLIVANNVLAHVPDVNDFVEGFSILLAPEGVVTIEFPHLLNLIKNLEFDTIYHEHFSYFSLLTAKRVLEAKGLRVFAVEKLPTHGGSLRLYVCHMDSQHHVNDKSVSIVLKEECEFGLDKAETYDTFEESIQQLKRNALSFLIRAKNEGKRIIGFGAPAKACTFLNYCGIGTDMIEYTVDETPYKQGCLIPGVRIPIRPFEALQHDTPDIIVIFPWNWSKDIAVKLDFLRARGCKLITCIPEIQEV